MVNNYAMNLGRNYNPDPNENVFDSIFREYERVIFESIISSFSLDFIVTDRHGGDVDTIHNVRQIGIDTNVQYKNSNNQKTYENLEGYKSYDYHGGNQQYRQKVSYTRKSTDNGVIADEYTGREIAFSKVAPGNLKAAIRSCYCGKRYS